MSARRALDFLKDLTQQDQSDQEPLIEAEHTKMSLTNPNMDDLQAVTTKIKVENEKNTNCLNSQVDDYQGGAAASANQSQEAGQTMKLIEPPFQGNDASSLHESDLKVKISARKALNFLKNLTQQDQGDEEPLIEAKHTELGINNPNMEHLQDDDYQGAAAESENQPQEMGQNMEPTVPPLQGNDASSPVSEMGVVVYQKRMISDPQDEMEVPVKKRRLSLQGQVNLHQGVAGTAQAKNQNKGVTSGQIKLQEVAEEDSQHKGQDGDHDVGIEDEELRLKLDLNKKNRKVSFNQRVQMYHYTAKENPQQNSSDEDYTDIKNVLGCQLTFHPIADGYFEELKKETWWSAFRKRMEGPCVTLTMVTFIMIFFALPLIVAIVCLYFGLFHNTKITYTII
uniref:Uncharacterized protein LOC114335613 isoform X2 n=1 Tax=Diabrotica virgifera virgifera TaxID=50390 RepID=A0A6P7GA20_DIAVI